MCRLPEETDRAVASIRGPSSRTSAGVNGAQAGTILPANPEVGMAYRQEWYAGEAEDRGEVVKSTRKLTCLSERSTTS